MSKMISGCGLVCTECPAYQATQTKDQAKAQATAEQWAKMFQTEVTIDDVWCDGCLVAGRKCTHCGECEIRACVVERGLENCAQCSDYACDKLSAFFKMVPHAEKTLERLRASL